MAKGFLAELHRQKQSLRDDPQWLVNEKREFAVVVVLTIRKETAICVRDPYKHPPLWKFSGGKGEPGETPRHAATREVWEETGVLLDEGQLRELSIINKQTHELHVYCADLASMPSLKKRGDEGEEIRTFRADEIVKKSDFLEPHKQYAAEALAVANRI